MIDCNIKIPFKRYGLIGNFIYDRLCDFLGFVLIIGGCGILVWNEGRAVKTAVSLQGT